MMLIYLCKCLFFLECVVDATFLRNFYDSELSELNRSTDI